jgi:UDP-2,3-diacylglucosamine pyrophosphatase LpxH
LSSVVEQKAIKYAKLHKFDVICCGHTHEAKHSTIDGVDYYNSGCWVKNEATYIAFKGSNIEIIQEG